MKNNINNMKNHHYKLVHFIDGEFEIDVNFNKETVWLTQKQICQLFERDRTVITRHINNIFKEGELDKISNVQKMHFPNSTKPVSMYNLDIVISIGYRVKSKRGIKFRQWANKILKSYLIDGYAINISRLKKENENLKELQKLISLVHKVALEDHKDGDEIRNLLNVIKDYEYALDLLDSKIKLINEKIIFLKNSKNESQNLKEKMNSFKEIFKENPSLIEFDGEIFESMIERIVVGRTNEETDEKNPYSIIFIFKSGLEMETNDAKKLEGAYGDISNFVCSYQCFPTHLQSDMSNLKLT